MSEILFARLDEINGFVTSIFGDITVVGSPPMATINPNAVTFGKFQQINASQILGNPTGALANVSEISLGVSLAFSGTSLIRSALTGDVTASANSNATTIAANAVTFGKFQQIATDRLLGRDTAATGNVEAIALDASLQFTGTGSIQRAALSGDVTASAGSNATTIAANAVTFAKMADLAAVSLIGNPTGGATDPSAVTLNATLSFTGTTLQRAALTGDVTAAAGSNSTTIAASAVTNAKLANMAAATIKGRQLGAGTGAPEDLTAAQARTAMGIDTDDSVTFGRVTVAAASGTEGGEIQMAKPVSGTTLGGDIIVDINTNSFRIFEGAGSVRGAFLDITTAAAGAASAILHSSILNATLEFSGGNLRRAALTGDVTASAGSNATTIANDVVTFAKMQNITTDRLLGRDTAASGDIEEIALDSTLEFTGSTSIRRAALTGDVTASAGSNSTTLASNLKTATIIFIIDGGGSAITTGVKGDVTVDFACTINQWTLIADQSGSIVVDIWKDTYANYPPVVGDSITASAKPTISAATKGQSSTLTGWTTSVTAGDTFRINVDSASTVTRVTLVLKVTKT